MGPRRRLLHIVTGLEIGGAELALLRLATALSDQYTSVVVNLSRGGALEERFSAAHITVHNCGLKQHPVSGFLKLIGVINEFRPDLIQSWMYHANLTASLANRFARRRTPLVWSVRHSLQAFSSEKWSLRQIIRLGGFGFWHPDVVTYNAHSGQDSHLQFGYGRFASEVIVNGVDLQRFERNLLNRESFRRQHQYSDEALLVGYVGRFHSVKDIPTLIGCFAAIHQRLPQTRFVIAGRDLVDDNPALNELLVAANLEGYVRCLGPQEDVVEIYSGIDLMVLSSLAEGTANVLLEAMACEVPCITTDAGDCARLVGESRFVAPPRNWSDLAAQAIAVLELDPHTRDELGISLRRRMADEYDQSGSEASYRRLYDGLLECEVPA